MNKISIRFFDDKEVRAVWDDEGSKWWFSVVDIVGVLSQSADSRNYWYVLKSRLKKAGSEVLTNCKGFRLVAPDGKRRLTDCLTNGGVIALAKEFPGKKANRFIEWFTYRDETIDGTSKSKASALFDSSLLGTVEVGTVRGLQQIHGYLFGGLYDFAGQIRTLNIAKGDFQFAMVRFLPESLRNVEAMPENTFDEIADKYVEMNVAHPFMEGNGRSTRIWLDLILKKSLKLCVDWSQVDKKDYLAAMKKSVSNSKPLKSLLQVALTDRINDREVFVKGIDYSYYYEQEDDISEGD
ncbi:MAG: Fic family protein [Coriobacteriales bacterium]|jgi:cell filamentation protein|nr:Fic family protein [Coriobacteriales bacterium]